MSSCSCYRALVNLDATEISRAVQLLRQGRLVAFPTETVYGLAADALSDHAVARLYEAKGRPQFNPLIAHASDLAMAQRYALFPEMALRLARHFWPGPLTLVLPRALHCPISSLASAGLGSVAFRVPRHDMAQAVISTMGHPLVAPSANRSGALSPTLAAHVRASLGDRVDMIIDGGACPVGVESTVISFFEGPPLLLRAGGLTREEIETVARTKLSLPEPGGPLHAPGQLQSHYAPRAALRLNSLAPEAGEAYVGFGSHDHGPHNLSRQGDLMEAAANLFRLLHEIDNGNVRVIAVAPIPDHGLGEAVNDRLRRAAVPRSA